MAVDHCTAECIGIRVAKEGTRSQALEPLRQGAKRHFGGYADGIAAGLKLRHDHGSQVISDVPCARPRPSAPGFAPGADRATSCALKGVR